MHATPAESAPPREGVFVLGQSLGGVAVGVKKARIFREWGREHGVCRNCRNTTWYFNSRPFAPHGTGVVLAAGRAVHVFTVWQPNGWRTGEGIELGAPASDVLDRYGPLSERSCTGYEALVTRGPGPRSVFYIWKNELWGFGLSSPGVPPCL